MSSRFQLTTYYDTCYTSFFLDKIGPPIVCFHPKDKKSIISPNIESSIDVN
jgi:hypothetical protein